MEIQWLQLLAFISVLSAGGGVELAERKDIHRIDVVEGDTLTLSCDARPKLLRSYRWVYIREGTRKPRVLSSGRRLVVGETRLSIDAEYDDDRHVKLILKLKDIRAYEAGLFMCWRQGLKPDPQVFVRVLKSGTTEAEPLFIEISAPSYVDYGGTATIDCLIFPSWPGKVLWYKGEEEISSLNPVHTMNVEERPGGELLASLKVISVREDASYTCKVPSNPKAEATFNLVVRFARIENLSSTPSKDEIEYGETLSFECLVSGTDNEILWLKDGNNLSIDNNDGRLHKEDEVMADGKIRSELVIDNFSVGDNGHYVCYVPGDSKGILVNIEGRPPRVLSLKGWDFIVGDVLRLTCSTQYARGEKNVTWLFEGQPLRADWWAENVVREDSHNITHHDLSLPIPTRAHVGSYACYTSYGHASTEVKEIVLPYVEESPPRSIEVPEGKKLTLRCSIAGYPVPTVLWEKNIRGQWKVVEEAAAEGDPEVEGVKVYSEHLMDGTTRVGERQELLMAEALPFHAGEYRCKGHNERESTLVETEVTIVAPAPAILEVHADPVMEGEDLKITCSVINWDGPVRFVKGIRVLGIDGNPRFESHLIAKEEPPPDEGEEGPLRKDGRRGRPKPVVYSHALVISDVTLADEGHYECHAGSDAMKSTHVTVNVAPPEVVEVAASPAVVGSEIFVSCTVTNMPLDEKVVFYFNGKNLSEEEDPRYSVHLAELTGELVVNDKGRAKQATYVLKVLKARQEDSGVYHCTVGKDARGTVDLEVQDLEDVEEVFLEATSPYVGGDLVLKCTVVNWDRDVSFFLNQTMLLAEEDARFYLSRKHEGNTTVHSLIVFDVTQEDSGFYQCFTSPIISAEVNVTVKELVDVSVELQQRPKGTPVLVGTSLVLDCRVHGFKGNMHTIEFSHQGRPYLYFDSTITGPQVNQRASLLTEDEESLEDLDPRELSFRMKLDSVNENDAGMWVCRATIPQAGFAQEAFVSVEIFVPPRFTELPDSEIQVEYGSDVILNCIVTGSPVPSVRWLKEGIPEPIAQNETGFARLEVNGFEVNDTGVYVCEATSFGHIIRSFTKLDVIKELKFIEMPDPQTILVEGSPAVLRCMALSSPPSENPIVTWSRKGTDKVLATGYEMASYTIESPKDSDAGEYVCKATILGVQEIISTEVIIVSSLTSQLPSSTMAPTLMSGRLVEISGPYEVEEGDTMTLMCLVSPLLAYYKYITVKNGTILTFEDELSVQDPRMSLTIGKGGVGETLLRLTIQDVSPSDQGHYECTVNTEPIARHTHFVAVVPEGSITTSVAPKPAKTETTKGTSSPQSTQGSWVEGTSPSADDRDPASSGTQPAPTSSIPSTFGPTYPIPYEAEDFPKSISKTVISGNPVTLPCTFLGDTESPIIWKLEENDFLLSVDLLQMQNDKRFDVEAPDEFTRNFIIRETRTEDSGTYTCLKQESPDKKIHVELYVLESIRESSPSQGTTEFFYLYTPSTPLEKEEEEKEATEEPETKEESEVETYLVTVEKEVKKGVDTTTHSYFEEEEKEMIEEDKRLDEEILETTVTPYFVEKEAEDDIHFDSEVDTTEIPYFEEKEEEDSSEESGEDTRRVEDIPHKADQEEELDTKKPEVTVIKDEVNYEEREEEEEEKEKEAEDYLEEDDLDDDSIYKPKEVVEPTDTIDTFEEPESEIDLDSISASSEPPAPSEEDSSNASESEISESKERSEDRILNETLPPLETESEQPNKTEDKHAIETIDQSPDMDYPEESFSTTDTTEPQSEFGSTSTTSMVYTTTGPRLHFTSSHEPPSTESSTPTERSQSVESTSSPPAEEEKEMTPKTEEPFGVEEKDEMTEEKIDFAAYDIPTMASPIEGVKTTLRSPAEQEEDDATPDPFRGDFTYEKLPLPGTDVIAKVEDDDVEDSDDVTVEGDYYYYTDTYDEVTSTPKPEREIPVIIAEPGDTVEVFPETEVVLPCPTDATAEDITWKDLETLLFLGSLDLAGVEGLALSPEGKLRLLSGVSDTKDDKTYTCYVFDYDTYEDELVTSYHIELNKGEPLRTTPQSEKDPTTNGTTVPPTSTYEFPGLEWQEVGVIANSRISGESLVEVLREGGLNAVLIEGIECRRSDKVMGWKHAQEELKECEGNARKSGLLRSSQSLFLILDFKVNLGLDLQLQYGSTLIYVHNFAVNLTAHVFGPLVPLNGYTSVECGSPVYSSQKDDSNVLSFCKSSVASTLLKLQEAYVSHSRKLPMA